MWHNVRTALANPVHPTPAEVPVVGLLKFGVSGLGVESLHFLQEHTTIELHPDAIKIRMYVYRCALLSRLYQ